MRRVQFSCLFKALEALDVALSSRFVSYANTHPALKHATSLPPEPQKVPLVLVVVELVEHVKRRREALAQAHLSYDTWHMRRRIHVI